MRKFKVVFIRKEQGKYVVFRQQLLKAPLSVPLQHAGAAYAIDWKAPLYITMKGVRVYVMNAETGGQITTKEHAALLLPEDLDTIVNTKIVREIAQAVNSRPLDKLVPLIIGVVLGLLVGYIVADALLQGKVDALLEQLADSAIVLPALAPKILGVLGGI